MLGTLMLPYHVTLVPQYILFLNFGWVNTFLPLVVPKFLAVDAFFIFLMVQFFRGIPREIDEAAIMDGCGPVADLLEDHAAALDAGPRDGRDLLLHLDLRRLPRPADLPQRHQRPTPCRSRSAPSSTAGGESLYGELFAMSALSLVPVFVVFLAFQRLIIRGVALGALKR